MFFKLTIAITLNYDLIIGLCVLRAAMWHSCEFVSVNFIVAFFDFIIFGCSIKQAWSPIVYRVFCNGIVIE